MGQDIKSAAIRPAKHNTNRTLWNIDAARQFAFRVIDHHLSRSQIDVPVMILGYAFAASLYKQLQIGNRSFISYIPSVRLLIGFVADVKRTPRRCLGQAEDRKSVV